MKINAMIKWIAKRLENLSISPDIIDLRAEIDGSLTLKENWDNIKAQFNIDDKKINEKNKEVEIEHEQMLKQIADEVTQNENTEIEKIRTEPSKLDKYFEGLKDYISILTNSNKIHGLLVVGSPATGKTRYVIKNTKDTILLAGHITPLRLYMTLFENQDKMIVIDDPTNIFKNMDSTGLLLQALQTEDKRVVQWQSNWLTVRDIPMKIEFNGKIIIIANKTPKDMDVLLSRCLLNIMKFRKKDKIIMMYDFCKENNIPIKIMDYVKPIINEANLEKLNFRFILKTYEFFKMQKNWKHFAINELEIDEYSKLIYDLENKALSTNDKIKEWIEESGKSRASYFRQRKNLLDVSYSHNFQNV